MKRSHEEVSEDVFVYHENTDLSSIPTDITGLRIDDSVKKIPPDTFEGREQLVNVEYPEGLEVIGGQAFQNCTLLEEQHFPSTLVEIGPDAFNGCYEFKVVGSFPVNLQCEKLQSIEILTGASCLKSAFAACTSLTHARLPLGMVTISPLLFRYCNSLFDVNVPSSVIEIGVGAFDSCQSLALIELPIGLKLVGHRAFSRTGLKCFHFPSTVEAIGSDVLSDCEELESATLPSKLKAIPNEAFQACSALKNITIPISVVTIGIGAFVNSGLTHLDLSKCNLTKIERAALAFCSQLKTILLPRTNLEFIDEETFKGCSSLTHLRIPPTVDCIEGGAFADCTSLLSVEVPETLEDVTLIVYNEEEGYLGGYNPLVNFCLPPSEALGDLEDYNFMNDMKLREAANDCLDLVNKLEHRFDGLPLHRACYFQNYHTLEDNIDSIQNIVNADPAACSMWISVG
ncbi:unnamed protein product [Cylindrotheca closterium]|uniref:Uncharacterized protein n=1 Tax=Cylindrotheca closterium TaxID=2856 RepID=A0AAD2G487_9STRA|nr:unnamed protein product [Cylindrotheca closterium]